MFRQRPYCIERTRSHLNSEVKQCKARLVLGWETAWEALRVPLAFFTAKLPNTIYRLKCNHRGSNLRGGKKTGCDERIALRCTLSQNGYGKEVEQQPVLTCFSAYL
jgi:hypothetical protein